MAHRNVVWRQTLVAIVYHPQTGELRDPLVVLSVHDQLDRARRALTACLAEPLSPQVLAQVRTALEPTSLVPLEGEAVLCPTCQLPGHLSSLGGA